jgi:hypothetical protein
LTVRWIDWRVSSGEERWITAEAGDWFAVPRRGRVDEAVGVALGAVRGAGGGRARRRGMLAVLQSKCRRAGQERCGVRRIATAQTRA